LSLVKPKPSIAGWRLGIDGFISMSRCRSVASRGDEPTSVDPPAEENFRLHRVCPENLTQFENRTSTKAALFFMCLSEDYLRKTPTGLQFAPFLSAKRLVTTQTFRDLFRNEYVHGAESINIKEMTFLFTDLKGSTALLIGSGPQGFCPGPGAF
jgi:hypothetical protein